MPEAVFRTSESTLYIAKQTKIQWFTKMIVLNGGKANNVSYPHIVSPSPYVESIIHNNT